MTELVQRLRREWMATQAATPKQLWVMVEKAQWMECTSLTREAADAIALLTAERDEARRQVCKWVEMDGATTAKHEAELRGWDCLKEDGK